MLRELSRRGELTAGKLSRSTHFGQPTIKVILDRLESLGIVERDRDPGDRRSFRIRLTDPGRDVCERAPHLLQERFRRRFATLDPWEQKMIVSVLQRVVTMMDREDERATA